MAHNERDVMGSGKVLSEDLPPRAFFPVVAPCLTCAASRADKEALQSQVDLRLLSVLE